MPKNFDISEDCELEQLIQSLIEEEEEGTCTKCGHKMIQQYKTEWSELTTEIKMRCQKCGHTQIDSKKLLS